MNEALEDQELQKNRLALVQKTLISHTLTDLKTSLPLRPIEGKAFGSEIRKENSSIPIKSEAQSQFNPLKAVELANKLMPQKPLPVLPSISRAEESVDPEDIDIDKSSDHEKDRDYSPEFGESKVPIIGLLWKTSNPRENINAGFSNQSSPPAKKSSKLGFGRLISTLDELGPLQRSERNSSHRGILKKSADFKDRDLSYVIKGSQSLQKKVSFNTHKTVFRFLKEMKPLQSTTKTSRNIFEESD